MKHDGVELLAPAGDFETALAAFDAGADAVYCGLADFSARAFAKNFSSADLAALMRVARARARRVFVTFNTLVDEDALEGAIETLAQIAAIGPDALIVQDLGIARVCRRHFPALELHASTQLVAHNLEGVLALKELGFRRVVLARELSLEEISLIARRSGAFKTAPDGRPELELECFVHGALCYSISGLCLFSALEKGRSGNRGKCAYCCRLAYPQANGTVYPFSMKDLRVGEDVRKLVDAGVVSLKIEGRMKSALYVASVTRHYRQILDRATEGRQVTRADLETVFSRRTTELYLNGHDAAPSPIDPESLGHLGTEIGVVKRVTKDREGQAWLRFHTARALEKHDGLQFEAMAEGRHLGLGIVEMRQALSRHPVFEVAAGTDVEILLPEGDETLADALKPGQKIYCSMSNAVKRMFPAPSYRPSDYPGTCALNLAVTLGATEIAARASLADGTTAEALVKGAFAPAKDPTRTADAVRKAFAKLGETDYCLGTFALDDPQGLFAPASLLNDLRRDLVERLDDARDAARRTALEAALADDAIEVPAAAESAPRRVLRLRPDQVPPPGVWDEVVLAITAETETEEVQAFATLVPQAALRLGLPVYTAEPAFNRLRTAVRRLVRAGFARWEAADLATLRMLHALGVTDLTADWTLYAFNSRALAALTELGVRRFVASPENGRENLQYLVESGCAVECLVQQSTPLFISLTQPAATELADVAVFRLGSLWITTKRSPRTFVAPKDAATRIDLSWDPQ